MATVTSDATTPCTQADGEPVAEALGWDANANPLAGLHLNLLRARLPAHVVERVPVLTAGEGIDGSRAGIYWLP